MKPHSLFQAPPTKNDSEHFLRPHPEKPRTRKYIGFDDFIIRTLSKLFVKVSLLETCTQTYTHTMGYKSKKLQLSLQLKINTFDTLHNKENSAS